MSLTAACGTSTLLPLLSMRITLPEIFPVEFATCCDMQQLAVSAVEIISIAIVRMAVSGQFGVLHWTCQTHATANAEAESAHSVELRRKGWRDAVPKNLSARCSRR